MATQTEDKHEGRRCRASVLNITFFYQKPFRLPRSRCLTNRPQGSFRGPAPYAKEIIKRYAKEPKGYAKEPKRHAKETKRYAKEPKRYAKGYAKENKGYPNTQMFIDAMTRIGVLMETLHSPLY